MVCLPWLPEKLCARLEKLNPALRFFFFFSLFYAFCFRSVVNYHCNNTIHVFKNIKNWSHDTIHIFKNYFTIMFSVFSFSNNKFNPNGIYFD